MGLHALKTIARVGLALAIWGGYAAFVAMLTASWMTSRVASAEIPPARPLGEPTTEADPPRRSPPAPASATEGDTRASAAVSNEPKFGPPAPTDRGGDSISDDDPQGAEATGLAGEININRASEEELALLPGIGDALAARIVTWREEHKPFPRPADVRRVRGIGAKTFDDLRPHLRVSGPTTLREP